MDSDTPAGHAVLLGRLAAGLADGLPLAAGLDLLVVGLGLRSAVLRRAAPGAPELLAVAGDARLAVPAVRPSAPPQPSPVVELLHHGAAVDLPVPGRGGTHLTVVGADPGALPVLRAAAAVLGLAVAAGTRDALADEVGALLLEEDQDGDALADALHDGPVQSLVVARYACDAAVRGGDPALARDAVQEAVVALRRTLWHLRSRGADDLPEALDALAARLAEAGEAPLVLALDADAAARLSAPARTLAFRLVQSVARAAEGPVRVRLRSATDGAPVRLEVDGGRALDGPDRWRRRLRALGGHLTSSAGGLRVELPAPTPHRTATHTATLGNDDIKACS